MSHRTKQIESILKRAISTVVSRDLSDPRIRGLVSVLRVQTSADLRRAQVYISVIPESLQSRAIHGLTHASGRIKALLKDKVSMRSVPDLVFCLDDSIKKQSQLFQAIARGINREAVVGNDERERQSEQYRLR